LTLKRGIKFTKSVILLNFQGTQTKS